MNVKICEFVRSGTPFAQMIQWCAVADQRLMGRKSAPCSSSSAMVSSLPCAAAMIQESSATDISGINICSQVDQGFDRINVPTIDR